MAKARHRTAELDRRCKIVRVGLYDTWHAICNSGIIMCMTHLNAHKNISNYIGL